MHPFMIVIFIMFVPVQVTTTLLLDEDKCKRKTQIIWFEMRQSVL